MQEVAGSSPGNIKTQDRKIIKEKVLRLQARSRQDLPCSYMQVPYEALKNPHYSRTVGDGAPGVVAVLYECLGVWV